MTTTKPLLAALPPVPLPGSLLDDAIAQALAVGIGDVSLATVREVLASVRPTTITLEEAALFRDDRLRALDNLSALVEDFATAARTVGANDEQVRESLHLFRTSCSALIEAFLATIPVDDLSEHFDRRPPRAGLLARTFRNIFGR